MDKRLFTAENLERLFERCVCVRVRPGPQAAGDDAALARRLHTRVQPALLFLDGQGNLLHRQFVRLYPAYLPSGEAEALWPERLLGFDDLMALVDRVEKQRQTQEEAIQALRAEESTEARLRLAQLLRERGRPDEARTILTSALAAGEDHRVREALAELEEALGRFPAAREHIERALRSYPDAADAPRWRLAVARLALEEAIQAGAPLASSNPAQGAALAQLRAIASSDAEPRLAVEARLVLARAAQIWGGDIEKHLRWLGPRTGGDARSAPGWTATRLHQLLQMEQSRSASFRAEAARHARQLVTTFPDSVEAQMVKHGSMSVPQVAAPVLTK